MTPQSARLAWVAFILLWLCAVSSPPRRVAAFEEPPDFRASLEAAIEHLEVALPAEPGGHAVEYWNGVVCEQDDTHPDRYTCSTPPEPDE